MNEYTILDYTTINHIKVYIGYKDKTIATWLMINNTIFNIRFYSNIHIADNDYYDRIASITVCTLTGGIPKHLAPIEVKGGKF